MSPVSMGEFNSWLSDSQAGYPDSFDEWRMEYGPVEAHPGLGKLDGKDVEVCPVLRCPEVMPA